MYSWAEKLLVLQETQIRMAKLQKMLDGMPAEMKKVEEHYARESAAVKECQESIKACELKIRSLDSQIESIKTKKKDFQAKTSLIKSNDEYRAALTQIEMCDVSIKSLEDEQLIEMEKQEELKATLATRSAELKKAQERATSVKKELEGRANELREQIDGMQKKLPALQEGIEPAFLKEYLRLRASKLTPATFPVLVPVNGESCGGCHMQVTMQLINNTINGKLTCCPSCHAMLYYEE
ncbi:MAG: hypothetical protein J6X55_05325 [Victivallales bacterium]|nr:hypothetical protein [Victivallales bacterium]